VPKEEGINESSIIYDATIVVMREDVGWRRENHSLSGSSYDCSMLIEVEE